MVAPLHAAAQAVGTSAASATATSAAAASAAAASAAAASAAAASASATSAGEQARVTARCKLSHMPLTLDVVGGFHNVWPLPQLDEPRRWLRACGAVTQPTGVSIAAR